MAYKLTAADRRRQAALMRAQSTKRYTPKKVLNPPKAVAEEKPGTLARVGATAGDMAANVLTGLGKGIEGIVDFTAGIVGGVGGIFSKDFQDGVKDFVAEDYTSQLYGDALQRATRHSYTNEGKGGKIAEGIAQGVGQILPAVALTVVTHGAGASAAVSQLASLGVTMTSAAGTATEEAFKEGAGYGEGMAYGAVSGAVEGATEKLTGGLGGLYGKGLVKTGKAALKEGAEQVAKTGLKRVLSEAAGEGVEEMISELAAPATKTIYKGRDALAEYGDADYWKGVGEAGIIGAGTSIVYGGSVGRITKTSGIYADVSSVTDHIAELEKQRSRTDLSQAQRVQIERSIKADQVELANRLGNLSEDKRKRVFQKMPGLALSFDENGQIRAENLTALDANIAAAADTTYDVRFRSATASAERITTALANGSTDTHEMRAYSGAMTEAQQQNLDGVRELMGAASERSGGVVGDFVVAEKSPEGGAYFDKQSGLIVIGVDSLENGTAKADVARALENAGWQETVVHEIYHGVENTTAGVALAELVTGDETLHGLAVSDVLSRGYMKEYFGENADVDMVKRRLNALIAKENAGQELTADEQVALDTYKSEVSTFAVQRLLGTKSFVKKLITTEPTTAEKLIGRIRELAAGLKNKKSPDAKAQAELLKKAESLFMKALSEAGGTIDADGKIHLANREDEETEESTERGVRWSLRVKESNGREHIVSPYEVTREDVDRFLNMAKKRKLDDNTYFPVCSNTPQTILSSLQASGFDVTDKPIAMQAKKARQTQMDGDSYIDEGGIRFRCHALKAAEVLEVLDSMESPQYIIHEAEHYEIRSGKDGQKRKVLIPERFAIFVELSSGKECVAVIQFDSEIDSSNIVMDGKGDEFHTTVTVFAPDSGYDTALMERGYTDEIEIERPASRSTIGGTSAAEFEASLPVNSISQNSEMSTPSGEEISGKPQFSRKPLQKRLAGDALLDAQDLISDVQAVGAQVDEYGYITLYHRTSAANAAAIRSTGEMVAKEDGLFFSTKIDGQNIGYGDTVVTFSIPAEKLLLDDIFDDEAHLRFPLKKPGRVSMKDYLVDKGGKVSRSRKTTGEVVTLSKGELAKLHANYAGDKIFNKGAVVEAVKGIDALKRLPAATRNELVTRLWRGYNERLHQQGFEQFTEIMWHQIHAEILQESGFDLTEDEIHVMDEQIVDALHAIVASGKPSIKARLESDTSTEGYRKQAAFWRGEHERAVQSHKRLNSLKYELEKLAKQKMGLYINAANYRGDTFKVAIDELAKMNWRGGLVSAAKIRERFAALAAWYTKENPLYKGDGGTGALFRQDIADALASLGNSQNGALTNEDLLAAETVVKYFAHEIESHATYYKDGKRLDAVPEVKKYLQKAQRAREVALKCGMWSNLMRSKFARLVADPAMLMRQADGYLSGFFTEQYEALRQGTIDAQVMERELSAEFEAFWDEHKAYGKRYNGATVKFGDVEMPLQEAISLYMTMKREHAFAGLAGAGFEIDGKKATENISDGFAEEISRQLAEDWKALPPEELLTLTKKKNAEMERAALAKVIEAKRKALYDQFTDEDKALIALMERAYEKCRDVKVKIDEIVQGYSNVTGGYYYPISRTGLAENVDAYTGFEGDRVTNLSMNRETVKNAHKLYIEPAHIVFMRHLKATSLYHGLGVFTDNFNRLYNLNVGTNANNPTTIRTELGKSNKFVKEMLTYFKELKQDVEGISKKRSQERAYTDAVAFIRSFYATYLLGFNPKVWVTQLSSLIAATNIIDTDCLAKGLGVSGKDVDEYCRLAWLRNNDGSAAMAQAVSTPQNAVQRAGRNALQKVRDVAMLPISKVDRVVIKRLFGACQLQVEKNGGAKVGTRENKVEAGKLLTRVILETQQNSIATERSAAMRSADELVKGFTMFSADAMKVGARFVDAFGELSVLKTLLKEARKAGDSAEVKRLEAELKRAKKQCVRATSALVGVAAFNAVLSYAFKWLYRRDDEESLGTLLADTFGNMLGGIPFVRDFWSFFQDGFEMDHFLISTVNDVLGTAAASFELLRDAASGKEITRQEALGNMRKVLYAAGQLSGVPVRNIYNVTTGLINRVSPAAGYQVESLFVKKPFSSDLAKAIEADDERMIGVISGLMLDEKVGIEDDKTRTVLRVLTGKGYSVLPRAVGDTVTLNGEERNLTGKQQKRFRTVYGVAEEAVADMVRLKRFAEQDDAVKERAIRFIYDVYWNLALEDVLGEDLAEKNVLFAEAIDIEKLALVIAMARSIEADKDKNGKAIAGTKKRKVEQLVEGLHLTAAQKYMVMGYLGYTNKNGREQVERYIGGLKLTKGEKTALLKYSGYEAA